MADTLPRFIGSRLPRSDKSLLILLTVLCGWLGAPAPTHATTFGDIVVVHELMAPLAGSHGYMESRIAVTNRSSKDSHMVRLTLPKTRERSFPEGIRSISRTVEVGPRSTVRVSLLQPCLPLAGEGLEVAIDGKTQAAGVHLDARSERTVSYRFRSQFDSETIFILLSRGAARGLEEKIRELVQKEEELAEKEGPPGAGPPGRGGGPPPKDPDEDDPPEKPAGGPPGGKPAREPLLLPMMREIQWVRSEIPVKTWSSNWLGYSSYDGVMVSGEDMRAMPAGVRSALWQYVECGGSLVVLGSAAVPESWQRTKVKLGAWSGYYPGFGECLVSDKPPAELWKDRLLDDSWRKTNTALRRSDSVSEANRAFPVVEKLSVPVRGLFVLMIFFAVIIGPVNLWVLTWKKRRIWMLWTVPVISLLTCVLVFGYTVFTEGWRGHARTEGLTVLDETSHRATTVSWAGYYTPLTPGDGLHFDAVTELTPQLRGSDEDEYRGRGDRDSARTVDWTHDQHLATGWVAARIPAYFALRKSEDRRERLTVRRGKGGTLTVVNGLGSPIDRLWLADRKGKVYVASAIDAGGEGELALAEGMQAAGKTDSLRVLLGSDWTRHYATITEQPAAYLRPGCYLAALEGAPFIEDALKGSARKARSLVYGIMREPVRGP